MEPKKTRDIRKTGFLQDVKEILAIKTTSRYKNSKRGRKNTTFGKKID
jgi:hypothetical protein